MTTDSEVTVPSSGVGRRAFVLGAGALAAAPPMVLGAARPALAARTAAPAVPAELDPERWEASVALAKDLLMVGPEGQDLKLDYLRVLIDEGLPATTQPKDILIVGAGISGIMAGILLKAAGHRVTILEANANRIGGRIKTFRKGPESKDAPFSDDKQYAEAGAMRLPDFHPLTLALVDKLGLPRRLFYNVDVTPETARDQTEIPPVVYTAHTGDVWRNGPENSGFRRPAKAYQSLVHANGAHALRAVYAQDPQAMNQGFGLRGAEAQRSTGELLDAALDLARDYYSKEVDGQRVNLPTDDWIKGWAQLIYDFDGYSMWRFLRERAALSEEVVHAIGTIENLTSRLALSFVHSFLTRSLVNPYVTYWELVGGTATLPYALLPEVEEDIRMNRRMIRLEQTDDGVRIETTSEEGGDDADSGKFAADTEVFTADVAIVTVPFSALRHVEVKPSFSVAKRRSVSELHYDSSTKVLLEFSRRWWEFEEADWQRELDAIEPGLYDRYQQTQPALATRPIHGGGSVSDGPNRFTYYPSHPVEGSDGGVVLASYTWAEEANRWDSLDDEERYGYALRGVQQLHGKRVEAFYTGRGQTQSWLRNRYACGEAAVFFPGQLSELHAHIASPEGRVYFAGEHTSLKHSWIEGALESAVRVAIEVN